MSLLVCPNCKVGMVVVPRNGVEIDVCPECQGVWLDRGELDRLMASCSQQANSSFLPRTDEPQQQSIAGFGFLGGKQKRDDDHQGHNEDHSRRYDHDDDHRGDDHRGKKRGTWMDIFD